MKLITLSVYFATWLWSATVVVDRVAVVVNNKVIKLSDIHRDLRITQFLNGQQPNLLPDARRKSAERLIEQNLLRDEIVSVGFRLAPEKDADAMLAKVRQDRFQGSAVRFRAALVRYGISEDDLRSQLAWQLTVLRYIEERFGGEGSVTDEDLRAYYNEHRNDLQRANPKDSSFETVAPQITKTLEGERTNRNYAEFVEEAKSRSHIRYIDGAFE